MSIVTIFEQLARTAHHKVNLNELFNEDAIELQRIFANEDAASLKALFNEKARPADRTTIFDL
ncbi:hypothetical protein [uncultured Legionella sp.]|uniref:hypothetical protein n=1 Tax=uncultured Legionella sp. TaxID=210934 RepID=UPI002631D5B2|nr:hypothetical protein [uncultured Legionella sp.]